MHPSWRDLVIEQVSGDRSERERFLRSSSLEGLLLALSTAGGASGERLLPLLREDREWDVVGDRLAQLIGVLDAPELTRLFASLSEARSAVESSERTELDHLADAVLRLVAGRWSRERRPIPIGALEPWFDLAGALADSPPAPELATTWVELAPTAPIDVDVQEELVRFDDWTTLCELLAEDAPDALARFRFPDEYRQVTEAFVAEVGRGVADPADLPRTQRELLTSILRRLNRVAPTDPVRNARLAARLESVREEPELPEVYLRPVSPELQQILEAPPVTPRSDEAFVARILHDL